MTFIDLFCGIGGFRIGLEKLGFDCVFSSDNDKHCQSIYEKNFGEKPFGDITKIKLQDIPDHEIICGGFPCQPFSRIGSKLGRKHASGNLFLNILDIITAKKPKLVFLENVYGLWTIDKGNTLNLIVDLIKKEGYFVSWGLLWANQFGLPTSRPRIYIIASKKKYLNFKPFRYNINTVGKTFLTTTKQTKLFDTKKPKLEDFLNKEISNELYLKDSEIHLLEKKYWKRQKHSNIIWVGVTKKRLGQINNRVGGTSLPKADGVLQQSSAFWSEGMLFSDQGCFGTMTTEQRSNCVYVESLGKARKLLIGEVYRIAGFPEDFKRATSFIMAHKHVGNAVCPPIITAIMNEIMLQGVYD